MQLALFLSAANVDDMLYMPPISCTLPLLLAACCMWHIACCRLPTGCTFTCYNTGRHAIYRFLMLVSGS
jgi:hypothetical protein